MNAIDTSYKKILNRIYNNHVPEGASVENLKKVIDNNCFPKDITTVIKLRFGLTGLEPKTYKEIGELLNFSLDAIRDRVEKFFRMAIRFSSYLTGERTFEQDKERKLIREKEVREWLEKQDKEIEDCKLSLRDLNLKVVTYRTLLNYNIKTIKQLVQYKENQLLNIEGLGRLGVNNIKECLAHYGWMLRDGSSLEFVKKEQERMEACDLLLNDPCGFRQIGLPTFVVIGLNRRNINTIEDLLDLTEEDLLELPQVGEVVVERIKNTLAIYGWELKTREQNI